jgi:XTP/dITP diphosphohydrolase
MKKLVVATHNRDKFKEMAAALSGTGWELLPAFEFPGAPEVVEDGATLEENSLKKAEALRAFTGLPSLADDTGLFVRALGGAPGIFAARYAGEDCSYSDNVNKLLSEMRGVPGVERVATFRTVISLSLVDDSFRQVSGEVHGRIVEAPQGTGGFGYDPVFLPDGSSRVFAEMTLEEKNGISHRGKALQKANQLLASLE